MQQQVVRSTYCRICRGEAVGCLQVGISGFRFQDACRKRRIKKPFSGLWGQLERFFERGARGSRTLA